MSRLSHVGDRSAAGREPARAADTRKANRTRRLERILSLGAREDGAVAMNPSLFVQAMLPHREVYLLDADGRPVEARMGSSLADGSPEMVRLLATHYSATNGEFTLTVRAGMTKGPSVAHPQISRGVPYGGLARLLLCFVITEARKQGTPSIDLGRTLTAFCERVDITPSGGNNGRIRYVLDQLQRLATCVVTFEWETRTGNGPRPGRRDLRGENVLVVEAYHFWHQASSRAPGPRGSDAIHELPDGGTITLSDKFWSEVATSCFPLDFRKAQFFRAHPTAYDLYLWLTYRLGSLQRQGRPHLAVSYDDLHAQLGSHYQTDEHGALTRAGKIEFGRSVRHALVAIRQAWPELDVSTPRGRLVIRATGPDVEHRPPRQR